jgi:hypothetical protein
MSILLFLREEEAIDSNGIFLKIFEFSTSIVTNEGVIDSLSVWVQGKSDNRPVLLNLWAVTFYF